MIDKKVILPMWAFFILMTLMPTFNFFRIVATEELVKKEIVKDVDDRYRASDAKRDLGKINIEIDDLKDRLSKLEE